MVLKKKPYLQVSIFFFKVGGFLFGCFFQKQPFRVAQSYLLRQKKKKKKIQALIYYMIY